MPKYNINHKYFLITLFFIICIPTTILWAGGEVKDALNNNKTTTHGIYWYIPPPIDVIHNSSCNKWYGVMIDTGYYTNDTIGENCYICGGVNLIIKINKDSIEKAIQDSIANLNKEEYKKKLELLKKNFVFYKDEFSTVGSYRHKYQTNENSWNRICLRTEIYESGSIYLESMYYAHNYLFITQVEVKIGDSLYWSDDVPIYSDYNRKKSGGGMIVEYVTYTPSQQNGIVEAIANSGDLPVRVRFVGDQYYTFTLSWKDKQAIKESYELSKLINKIKE